MNTWYVHLNALTLNHVINGILRYDIVNEEGRFFSVRKPKTRCAKSILLMLAEDLLPILHRNIFRKLKYTIRWASLYYVIIGHNFTCTQLFSSYCKEHPQSFAINCSALIELRNSQNLSTPKKQIHHSHLR